MSFMAVLVLGIQHDLRAPAVLRMQKEGIRQKGDIHRKKGKSCEIYARRAKSRDYLTTCVGNSHVTRARLLLLL